MQIISTYITPQNLAKVKIDLNIEPSEKYYNLSQKSQNYIEDLLRPFFENKDTYKTIKFDFFDNDFNIETTNFNHKDINETLTKIDICKPSNNTGYLYRKVCVKYDNELSKILLERNQERPRIFHNTKSLCKEDINNSKYAKQNFQCSHSDIKCLASYIYNQISLIDSLKENNNLKYVLLTIN